MRLAHQACHPERSERSRGQILRCAQNDTTEGSRCKVYQCHGFRLSIPLRRVTSTLNPSSFPFSLFHFQPHFQNRFPIIFSFLRQPEIARRGEAVGLCEVGFSPIPYCFSSFIWRAESGKHMIPRSKVLGVQYLEKVRLKKRPLQELGA
jgi:hypothetical protein